MRKTPEKILPEFVIRMLAYGILTGIAIIVIYSAQALFAQPAVKRSPPAPAAQAVSAGGTTAPPSTISAPSAGKPAAAGQPLQGAPGAVRSIDSGAAKRVTNPDATPAGKTPEKIVAEPKATVQPQPFGKALSVLGTGLLLSGSALLAGAMLGFLFGIPRSLQQQVVTETVVSKSTPATAQAAPTQDTAAQGATPQGTPVRIAYGANTSLEQISDWLTKILVGVGLTQLSSLPTALTQFADFAVPGLGGYETSGVFAVALLIYFMTCGFLMSYLWTRLYLGRAFSEADTLAEMRGEIETAVVSELQKKAQGQLTIDYEALRLTEKQLESGDVPQAELDKAFRGTSDIYRTHIYQLASKARSDNWREPDKKKKMERTIPVFRALIATDAKPEKERYHQNYAQLGFALAEAAPPDYANAIAALDKAIELRGSAETQGYLWNEFVRAKCLADPESHDPETKDRILKDLRVALKVWPDMASVIEREKRLSDWMKANHVSMRSLKSHAP